MEEGMGYLGKIVLASPPILGTPSLLTNDEISGLGFSSLSARECTHGATKFFIELVKERIESFSTMVFKQQNRERIKEQILKEHPNEAGRTWTQIKDKLDKLKRHYHKEKKFHNITVTMQDLSGFGLTPSMRCSLVPLRQMVYPVGWTMANMWV
jgi:hypothetical protein